MKKLILIIAIVFSGMLMQAQKTTQEELTDLDIAKALMYHNYNDIPKLADSLNLDMHIDDNNNIIVVRNGIGKRFQVKVSNTWSKYLHKSIPTSNDIIISVTVKYDLRFPDQMKDFIAYDYPYDDKLIKYEKKMGKRYAHLKASYIKFY